MFKQFCESRYSKQIKETIRKMCFVKYILLKIETMHQATFKNDCFRIWKNYMSLWLKGLKRTVLKRESLTID